MKNTIKVFFLTLSLASAAGVQAASADSLSGMKSACLTGDYAACSRYNAAVIARNAAKGPILMQGYDPFRIVPASHADRTPKRPLGAAGDIAVGKSDLTTAKTSKTQ